MASEREGAEARRIPVVEGPRPENALLRVIPEPIRPWIKKAHEQINERPWIEKPLEAALIYALTRVIGGLIDAEYEDALRWFILSLLMAAPLIAEPEFDSILIVCVFTPFLFAGADVASHVVSQRVSFFEFCVGVPVLMMIFNFSSLSVLRRYLPYSCGVFLSTLIGYALIINGANVIGLEDKSELSGYFIALTIALVLAIEMPITYRRHEAKRARLTTISNRSKKYQALPQWCL
jgi:hypothetical protein